MKNLFDGTKSESRQQINIGSRVAIRLAVETLSNFIVAEDANLFGQEIVELFERLVLVEFHFEREQIACRRHALVGARRSLKRHLEHLVGVVLRNGVDFHECVDHFVLDCSKFTILE